MTLQWAYLGRLPYTEAWTLQKHLRDQRIEGTIPDTLLLLEHPPTITLGRLRGETSLRHPIPALEAKGVHVIRSDRGGDATLHAPGQLVGYLIVDLAASATTLPRFVEQIALALCDYLASFQLHAAYDPSFPGVWINQAKIAAFGFHLQQDVTMHGFALNLQTDLSLFDLLIPCGLAHKQVSSLQQLTPHAPSPALAAPLIAEKIAAHLQKIPLEVSTNAFL